MGFLYFIDLCTTKRFINVSIGASSVNASFKPFSAHFTAASHCNRQNEIRDQHQQDTTCDTFRSAHYPAPPTTSPVASFIATARRSYSTSVVQRNSSAFNSNINTSPSKFISRPAMAAKCRGEEQCMAALKAAGIEAQVFTHPEVTNIEEWTPEVAKFNVPNVRLAKNMYLKGKKGELVLVFALADTKTDLKAVCKVTGAGSGALRFAPAEVLEETLGVVQGAVTPLALVNDANKAVIVVLDKALSTIAAETLVAVHPCRNDKSVLLTPAQIDAFLKVQGNKVLIVDFAAEAEAAPASASAASSTPAPKKESAPKEKKEDIKGETKLGLDVKKEEDFASWYTQVVTKSEMIEYYDVSGCYVIRPWAYAIWEEIRRYFADSIRDIGVEECYFPMFVSKSVLEREKDHVEGFAPEVAWVTKAGDTDLETPIAIRPTSETVMYPYFAKWIRSHRDLPVRLNQWCNVVRWEFSNPTPFIRTREFLWQEGHCAWATYEECEKEVRQILELYGSVYEKLLAVPVIPGVKTEKERFAGGFNTTTVETFIPSVGRGCQGATSHNLGQNFGKMFDIAFEDPTKSDGSKQIPWQNSWGLTTRTIGVMTMVHGDNIGLVLPPRVAQVQVVIVPVGITAKFTPEAKKAHLDTASKLESDLRAAGIRCRADLRDNYSPAWRFNCWELKGVPIRIELGPNEIKDKKLMLCLRYNGTKAPVEWDANVGTTIKAQLEAIQEAMFQKAKAESISLTREVTEWKDFVPNLNAKCRILAPWCGSRECEDNVKKISAEESKALTEGKEDERAPSMGAKSLCIPYDQPRANEPIENFTCICKGCTKKASKWVLWGRSY
eukprot:GILJ01013180.1.p1 GENE.GILJ01013180.1~~GILJ01013180.1.p1  ORF type:complete len:837 (+),score=181.59 GILJ01013180.1:1-2511(+)